MTCDRCVHCSRTAWSWSAWGPRELQLLDCVVMCSCPLTSVLRSRLVAVLLLAATTLTAAPGSACVEGDLRGDMITAQREYGATPYGRSENFNLFGAGWFRALEITKLGGRDDKTYVTLEVDGLEVFSSSFATLKNPWMQLSTTFIVANVRSEGDVSVMTVWYSPELKFRVAANVRVEVEEEGVESLRLKTVMNKPAPHEHVPGVAGTVAMPAFK